MKDIKEYLNNVEYFQSPRNIYLRVTQPQRLYGIDCCSFTSANSMINLIFPILYKEFNSISYRIYRNYKRSKDYYKQIKPIKLKLKEDDKWNNK